MSASKPYKSRGGVVAHWMNRFVRQFGFVLLPICEIERMDYEGRCAYAAMKKPDRPERDIGYFNGIADHASKTALQFRERYLPNTD